MAAVASWQNTIVSQHRWRVFPIRIGKRSQEAVAVVEAGPLLIDFS